MDLNNPIPQEWGKFVTQSPIGLEVIPAHLYSVKGYVSATDTILTFFDFVQGSRQDLTNMQQANMLPNPESFLIKNIRVFFWSNPQSDDSGVGNSTDLISQFTDVVNLTKRGVLNLRIGNKSYGPWKAWTLPANSFVKGAFSTGSDLLADYGQVDGMLYPLDPYLMIAPLQQFSVTMTWPAGAVTLSEGGTLNIEILFDGQLARAVQ